MPAPTRRSRAALCLALGTLVWTGCSDPTTAPTRTSPPPASPQIAAASGTDIRAAIAAQERHNAALLRIPGVVGTAVGVLPSGRVGVQVFVERPDVAGIPATLDDIPVGMRVTGRIMALSDPTTRQRPAPLGFSLGHPAITAGTLGALVRNASSQLFILSNNHVLANQNDANIGDAALQPGPFDGGTLPNDQIGTLAAFQAIDFSGGSNTIDAAIAQVTNAADVVNSTPTDDGYGVPSSAIFGDANSDNVFDDKTALLGLNVQKYGRTTKLTHGQVTGINGTITVCYEVLFIFCIKSATFVDQLIISPGGFSGGGDSGSLIVTDDTNRNPVALLFAGSETETIANRIDLVLNRFGVSMDGTTPPPPTPLTDIALTGVSAPSSVTQGTPANVTVAVKNVGNQNVGSTINVTLTDATAGTTIGTQQVNGLTAGASTTLNFSWTPGAPAGGHTLTAAHDFGDDNAGNNSASTTTTVNAPGTVGMHIGDLDATVSSNGSTWSAIIDVTVHDGNHQPLNGATVVGRWNVSGLNVDECTTGELGGNGTCIMLAPSIRKKSATFTVTGVTMAGQTYQATANHDPDNDSNGTSITAKKP